MLVILLAGALLPAAAFSQLVVTSAADSGAGSLRQAITTATSGTIITFASQLSGASILLTNVLTINTTLTIDASALAGGIQINGRGSNTVFNINFGNVILNSLTITNGCSTNSGGGIFNFGTLTLNKCALSKNTAGFGGAVENGGTMTVSQSNLSGNSSTNGGGAIDNGGMLTVTQSTLVGNIAGFGGAIDNFGTLTVIQSMLSGNSSTNGGGAIINLNGTATVAQSTLSGNTTAGFGGAIDNGGTVTVTQSSLSENSSTSGGGGIINSGPGATVTVNQSTLSGNTTGGYGGAIVNFGGTVTVNQSTLSVNYTTGQNYGGGGILAGSMTTNNISNSIVSGNSGQSGADILIVSTILTFGGSNIVQNLDNSGGSIVGTTPTSVSPRLNVLGNYGGPTETMPLLAGSPAIDTGSDSAANSFTNDQRGYARISGLHVDIGAVEAQIATNPPVLISPIHSAVGTFQFSFTNLMGGNFTVFASTNVALPMNQWSNLGTAMENPTGSGQFQFVDSHPTNKAKFYRVRSP